MPSLCFLFPAHAQHIDKTYYYAESFFFLFSSNLEVKSLVKKIIGSNIFKGMNDKLYSMTYEDMYRFV